MEVDESVGHLLAVGQLSEREGEEGDAHEEELSKERHRNEEFEEEDEEEGLPLVAADDVLGNLQVWARTLERPPKGNLKTYCEGLWRPDKQLCRIIKTRGNDLRSMGFPYEGDTHLFPEETLYLVERCKLEVGNLTTPELYEAVDLQHYLTYAYFRQTSLIVFRAEPSCPVGVAFEAYAPSSQFRKTAREHPIFYIMYGGTRDPVPSEEELMAVFKWAKGVPVKYAMVSGDGGVFAVNIAHWPLENKTQTDTRGKAAAATVVSCEQERGKEGDEDTEGRRHKLCRKDRREMERQRHQEALRSKEQECHDLQSGNDEKEGLQENAGESTSETHCNLPNLAKW